MDAATIILIIIAFLILISLSLNLSRALAGRAICTVISRFRKAKAVQIQNSRPLRELGINLGFHIKFFRDYKPWAFRTLLQSGVIREGFPGTYYLAEDVLARTNLTSCDK
jgi:hypothetical protein